MITIGTIYNSNNHGPVRVLQKLGNTDFYEVEFTRTGTVKKFRSSQIIAGCIRDPYAKSVCGVACTGDIKTKGKFKPYYSIWHDMINRCYNPHDKRASAYANATVAPEWLVFERFYEDVSSIDGFDDEKIRNGELVLDKDSKQRGLERKVYSKDTCVWLTKAENNKIQDGQQKPFIGISPDGTKHRSTNITEFAKEHGLDRKHISGILHGRGKTTKGWRFSYEEIV